ncbi:hypothetical protein pipiens_004945, partial [Culex pipiens pipiens]
LPRLEYLKRGHISNTSHTRSNRRAGKDRCRSDGVQSRLLWRARNVKGNEPSQRPSRSVVTPRLSQAPANPLR